MSVMRADLVEETALPRSFPELIELCDGEDRILHLEDVTDSLERIPGFILGRLLDHEPSPVISSKLDKRVHRKWLHCQELSNDRQLRTPRFELLCWGIMADNAEEILLHAGDVLAIRAPRVFKSHWPDDTPEDKIISEYVVELESGSSVSGADLRPKLIILKKKPGSLQDLQEADPMVMSPCKGKGKGRGKNFRRSQRQEQEREEAEVDEPPVTTLSNSPVPRVTFPMPRIPPSSQLNHSNDRSENGREVIERENTSGPATASNDRIPPPISRSTSCSSIPPESSQAPQREGSPCTRSQRPAVRTLPASSTPPNQRAVPRTQSKKTQTPGKVAAAPASPARERGPFKTYTRLEDCVVTRPPQKLYNVWAVITKIQMSPRATRGMKYMAQVYIQDPEFSGTYGFSDYQFSMLSPSIDEFPSLTVGSVIRIHHMVVQNFNNFPTGRVYNTKGVTVIDGTVGDPIEPITTAVERNFAFTVEDVEKVKELRLWWAMKERRPHEPQSQRSKRLDQVDSTFCFDLNCKILASIETRDPDVTVLRVTDGTRCPLPLLAVDEDNERGEGLKLLPFHRSVADVFVYGHHRLVDSVAVGNWVTLCGIRCREGDTLGLRNPITFYRLTIDKHTEADWHILKPTEHMYKSLAKTLEPKELHPGANGGAEPDDLEIDELLAMINDSPPQSTSSMFKDQESFNRLVENIDSDQICGAGKNASAVSSARSRKSAEGKTGNAPSRGTTTTPGQKTKRKLGFSLEAHDQDGEVEDGRKTKKLRESAPSPPTKSGSSRKSSKVDRDRRNQSSSSSSSVHPSSSQSSAQKSNAPSDANEEEDDDDDEEVDLGIIDSLRRSQRISQGSQRVGNNSRQSGSSSSSLSLSRISSVQSGSIPSGVKLYPANNISVNLVKIDDKLKKRRAKRRNVSSEDEASSGSLATIPEVTEEESRLCLSRQEVELFNWSAEVSRDNLEEEEEARDKNGGDGDDSSSGDEYLTSPNDDFYTCPEAEEEPVVNLRLSLDGDDDS